MHLTCIGAAERPHTEVRAGMNRSLGGDAREGMPAVQREQGKEEYQGDYFSKPRPPQEFGSLVARANTERKK